MISALRGPTALRSTFKRVGFWGCMLFSRLRLMTTRSHLSSTLLLLVTSVGLAALASACVGVSSTQECLDGDESCESGDARTSRPDRVGRGGDDGGDDQTDAGFGDAGESDGTSVVSAPCDRRTCDEVSLAGEALPDYDSDGLPDCIEGFADLDGDGEANCNDPDADGDGIPDIIEGLDDPDGDGIPGFLDPDMDGDGIYDRWEGDRDYDLDGIPNYRDLDSDDDGTPDAAEFGRAPGDPGQPIDRDGDGYADFVDLDSDGDGLPDSDEAVGCPTTSNRDQPDSDGDNYTDLLEVGFGSNPCDPGSDITAFVDFFFELPYEGEMKSDTLQFGTAINRGDVFFNMDTTGSMGGEISQLQSSLGSVIIPALSSSLTDGAYGVGHFDDHPCGGYGGGSDVPFALLQRITRNVGSAQNGVNRLPQHNGGDYFESGIESLYQIATGAGRSECGTVPAFNPAAGLVPGEADGTIGGAGFRAGSVPIVVHITDAPSHARGEGGYPYGATRTEMYDALGRIGARVIGVASGGDARNDLRGIGQSTSSRVPPCAWDAAAGGRPGGCGAGQCCTGTNGNGQSPDGDGLCTLVFDINDNGGGLNSSIVSGINALISFAPITVSTRVRRDEEEFLATTIDTALFITDIVPVGGEGPPGSCGGAPTPADLDGDGTFDGFVNVTPGSLLYFEVQARNTHVRGLPIPQSFLAYIDVVIAATGGAVVSVLDTNDVSILVPPDIKQ